MAYLGGLLKEMTELPIILCKITILDLLSQIFICVIFFKFFSNFMF